MNAAKVLVVWGAAFAALIVSATAAEISGAGATFPYPIYAKWADAYKNQTGTRLNYQAVGSGGGIKQIQADTVSFGASDMPLKADQLQHDGLVQFPTVLGGVVPVVHLAGVAPGEMTLDGPSLAAIYAGDIANWDDPRIKTLNPRLTLPHRAIAVVHRADGSGTTFIFTDYLSKVSAAWKRKVGSSTAVQWPVGIGAKGNAGVAAMVAQTDGAIGYVEYAYAKAKALVFTRLVNRDGKAVSPNAKTFQAAAAVADWTGVPGFAVILTEQGGAEAWPIVGATFILVHKRPTDSATIAEVLRFFAWAYANGASMADQLDYVPLPPAVVAAIEKMWTADIRDESGKPLYSPSK